MRVYLCIIKEISKNVKGITNKTMPIDTVYMKKYTKSCKHEFIQLNTSIFAFVVSI